MLSTFASLQYSIGTEWCLHNTTSKIVNVLQLKYLLVIYYVKDTHVSGEKYDSGLKIICGLIIPSFGLEKQRMHTQIVCW